MVTVRPDIPAAEAALTGLMLQLSSEEANCSAFPSLVSLPCSDMMVLLRRPLFGSVLSSVAVTHNPDRDRKQDAANSLWLTMFSSAAQKLGHFDDPVLN